MRRHFHWAYAASGLLAAALLLTPVAWNGAPRHLRAQDTCPVTADCGSGCTAQLVTGYCVRLAEVSWRGGLPTPLGTIKLGPSVNAECWLCECAYTYTDSNGNARFSRMSDLRCGASVGGVTTTGADKE